MELKTVQIFMVDKEFADRINVALGEIQGKFAIPVVYELQRQSEAQNANPAAFLAELEPHLAVIKGRESVLPGVADVS